MAQTNAVLKSTGGAANVTAKEVSSLAESLMQKSGVDDEAIASGENLLLTFTNIRNEAGKGNDIFNQATGVMLDMSVALGQDMKTSAIQVGKALNDPIKGMTALQRVGVSLHRRPEEDDQRMQESGQRDGRPEDHPERAATKSSAGRPKRPGRPCPASSTSSRNSSPTWPARSWASSSRR